MTTTPTGKVLVLGSDTRSFLSVVRSLGRRGLAVHVAWCPPDAPARRSRYIARAHALPAYSADDPAWLPAFAALVTREQFDLVIPCDDPSLLPLQLHREALGCADRLYLLSPDAFAVTRSKIETTRLASRHGIRVPREVVVHDEQDLIAARAALRLPAIVKPEVSFRLDALDAKQHVQLARTPEEFDAIVRASMAHGAVQLQEHFRGVGTGVEVLAYEGRILYAFQHLRIHEPLGGGGSSYRLSVALTAELLDATRRLMGALHYTGVAMVEFKLRPETGEWVLLEVNGRFWGSLPLAIAAGADFPYFLYQMLVLARRDFPAGYRVGLYCRNWAKDATWLWQNLRADRSDPLLMSRPLRAVAGELANVVTLRERSDTLVLDDPRPAVAELGGLLRTATTGLTRRLLRRRPRQARTLPTGPR
jgi:predicted ATP-grasp superfamily ATP-dependent carboligase